MKEKLCDVVTGESRSSARPVAEQAMDVVESREQPRVKDWVSVAEGVGIGAVNWKDRVEGPWIRVYGWAKGQEDVCVSEEQATR